MGQNKNRAGSLGNRAVDLSGQRFGRLVVIGPHSRKWNSIIWECACDCGGIAMTGTTRLRRGHTQSCGCLVREKGRTLLLKHGGTDSPTWKSWTAMKRRCSNPKDISYPNYGARGIAVCDRWQSFENFVADMGERPSRKHSIDRYPDTNGNYEPGNCRWATRTEQSNNTRRNRFLEHDGYRLTVTEWARKLGVKPSLIAVRLRDGWSVERTLTTPVNAHRSMEAANKRLETRAKAA